MSEPDEPSKPGKSAPKAWARHFDTIGDELLRLTAICGVDLREPDVLERVINNDATVCGKKNPIGFRKLHDLVIATFGSLNKAMDRIGTQDTKMLVDAIRERMDRQRALGGTARGKGAGSSTDQPK
jgi:hypothetical protein